MHAKILLSNSSVVSIGALPQILMGLSTESLQDISAAIDPAPDGHAGYGYWPVTEVYAETSALQENDTDNPEDSVDAGTKTVTRTYPAVYKGIADQRSALVNLVKAKVVDLIAAHFAYAVPGSNDPHPYQIDSDAQVNMTSVGAKFGIGDTNAHNGFWRDANNAKVAMSDAEVQAFFIAAADYKQAIITNMWDLIDDDIPAADTQAKIDAIYNNLSAGTGPTATGWPA